MTVIINQLNGNLDVPHILVLDDFHSIHDKNILDAMSYWVDYAPINLHVVLTSRTEPALPLPRWKVKRFAQCLYSADLLFTSDEIRCYCNEKGYVEAPETFIQSLQTRTAGWVAALHLVLEESSNNLDHSDNARIIQSFGRDSRTDISEYLATEIFTELQDDLQRFILDIFPLKRFDARLCNKIRQRDDSDSFIQMLTRRELFIIPLDESRNWFRLHELFTEAAKLIIKQNGISGPNLRHLANESLARQLYLESFEILVEGEDWVGLAASLSEWGNHLIREGYHMHLQEWLSRLPDHLMAGSVQLELLQAWCLVYDNKFAALPHLLASIKGRMTTESERHTLRVEIGLLDAYVERQHCHFEQAIELTKAILSQLDASELPLKSLAYFNLGTDLYRLGKLDESVEMLRRAINQGKLEQRFSTVVSSAGLMLWIQQIRGNFIEALNLHKSILTWVASFHDNQQQPDIISCWQNSALVMIHTAMGNLSAADSYLKPMLRFVDGAEPLQKILTWYVQAEWLRHAGRINEAREKLMLARSLLEQQNEDVLTLAPPLQAAIDKCDLDQGLTPGKIHDTIPAGNLARKDHPYLQLESLALRIRLNLQNTEGENPELLIDRLVELSLRLKSYRFLALAHVLASLWLIGEKREDEAISRLQQALLLGESNDYVGMFHAFMLKMGALFLRVSSQTVSSEYLDHIKNNEYPVHLCLLESQKTELRRQNDEGKPFNAGATADSGADSLSKRELEVLKEIEEGKPNKVIAKVLNLSPATVKAHIRNINSKLGASNRTEAISIARKRGLLQD
jgi:LuxR family maltose regulon positive regulatory protein